MVRFLNSLGGVTHMEPGRGSMFQQAFRFFSECLVEVGVKRLGETFYVPPKL